MAAGSRNPSLPLAGRMTQRDDPRNSTGGVATSRRLVGLALALSLIAAACGGDTATPSTTTATTVVTTTTTTAAPTETPKPGDTRAQGLAMGLALSETPTAVPDVPTTADYDEYVAITDGSGILAVTVPAAWSEVDGSEWVDNPFGLEGAIGVQVTASPDITAWNETWTTPGVIFGATDMLGATVEEILDVFAPLGTECTYTGRYEYDDGAYAGALDWWEDCGGVGTAQAVIIARPAGGEFTVLVAITLTSDADVAAADTIVSSFYVNNLTGDGGALDAGLDANYGDGELTYGFQPDPQELEMQAGGDIDVSAYLGGACAGFVTAQPDLDLAYSGAAGNSLRFYFVANDPSADTVMVINDPSGEWWCSDDSYDTYNPTIDFITALDGTYDIWVGTYSPGDLVAGVLYITELDANHP